MSIPPAKSLRPTRVRYAVLGVFCTLAFLTYLDRICIMRAQDDIARDLEFDRLAPGEGDGLSTEELAKLRAAKSKERLSWVFSAFTLGYLLFEVPGGRLGDRWGARAVLFRIVLWWSAFTALSGSADAMVRWIVADPGPVLLVSALVLVRFLFGAGAAGAFPNIARVMGLWFPLKDRGTAQGTIWFCCRLGGALAPTIMGTLMAWGGGWRPAFWALGLAGVAWAVLFAWWFRDRPEQMPGVNAAEADLIRSGVVTSPAPGHGPAPWRALLTSGNLWAIYGMNACVCFTWYFFITFIPKYLDERFEISFHDSEVLTGLPLLVGGVTCLIGGRLSDRLVPLVGRRWGRSLVGVVALLLAAGAAVLVPQARTAVQGVVLLCLVCAFQDLMVPVNWAVTVDLSRRHAGAVGGAMNTAGGIGAVLGPLVVARLQPRLGWDRMFVLFAASYLIGALLWLRVDASEPLEKDA